MVLEALNHKLFLSKDQLAKAKGLDKAELERAEGEQIQVQMVSMAQGMKQIAQQFQVQFQQDAQLYNEEYAAIRFDMKADLTNLFNWNTNIIFVSLICEWESAGSVKNQATIWDQRIPRNETHNYVLDLQNVKSEYFITDMTHGLRDNEIKVHLRWEQSPTIGPFYSGKHLIGTFSLPDHYVGHAYRSLTPADPVDYPNYFRSF